MNKRSNKKTRKDGYYCQVCGRRKMMMNLFKNNFCFWCFKKTKNDAYFTVSETLSIRESLKARGKSTGFKKFKWELISGWFPSKDTKIKDGVNKVRKIDKENDYYFEEIKDNKTGKILRRCEEPLSKHKKD
jgi:hypothetical protein